MKKPVFLTGSNRGLGLALAKLLNKASVPLVVSSRNAQENENILNSFGIKPQLNIQLDFDTHAPADVEKVLNHLPILSGAVHCASPYTVSQLTNASLEELQTYSNFFQNNFIFGKYVIERVRAGKGGRIVLIGSTAAEVTRNKNKLSIYGTYKNSLKILSEYITNEGKTWQVSSTYINLGSFREDSKSSDNDPQFLKQSSVAEIICYILLMNQDIKIDSFDLSSVGGI